MQSPRKTRRAALIATFVVLVAGLVTASAFAGSVVGTAGKDSLRGTATADKLFGKGGNDKLYGLGGNDLLNGGAGNDVLVGGPGKDTLACGPGKDIANADAQDKIGADCETILGLPKPGLSVADASQQEGNTGLQTMSFAVKLAKPSPLPVSVSYATANGTASAGSDYSSASGKLVFAPGEKSKQVAVTIAGDTEFEPDETLTLVLSNPVNATLVRASATGTIKNEDVQKPNGGRYNGTTSQGRSVSFDVSSDLSIVSAISINIDISCPSIGYTDPNERLDLPMALPLSPDWKFHYADSYSDSDGSISIRLDGALSATGAATGSFRLDLGVNTEIGVVQCSTGDVTWTASPPA